jgi:hypothetical protein
VYFGFYVQLFDEYNFCKRTRGYFFVQANVLFGDLPSGFIWIFCADQFERTSALHLRINQSDESLVNGIGNPETSIIEICEILDFLLESVGLGTEHLPSVFFRIINVLSKECVKFSIKELLCSLRLSCKIWNKIRLLVKNWDEEEKTRSGIYHFRITSSVPKKSLL